MTLTPIPIVEELLTETAAAERIKGRRAAVVEWLRSLRIARRGPTGIRCYRWSEILAHLPLDTDPVPQQPHQPRRELVRSKAV